VFLISVDNNNKYFLSSRSSY